MMRGRRAQEEYKYLEYIHLLEKDYMFSEHEELTRTLCHTAITKPFSVGNQISSAGSKEVDSARIAYQEKSDIYELGVILLDIIVGKHINKKDEVDICRHQLEGGITAHIAALNDMVN
ncbi:hypothetical protein AgCh_020061 [Apium graveolens]